MQTLVVFLRAVNVRPRWVKMEPLRQLLTDHGFEGVESYIQSGNLRVSTPMRSADKVATTVAYLIEAEYGFAVPCVVRTPKRLREVLAEAHSHDSPLPGTEPRRYVTFCAETPGDDATAVLNGWDVPGERVQVRSREIHWWLAKPAHEATLTNGRIEKLVGVATTRDLKVVDALADRWGA